jgi:hypothetical protein
LSYTAANVCALNGCASASETDFLLDLEAGAKFVLGPHLLLAAGLDLPLVFGAVNASSIDVVGRVAYYF